MVSTSGPICKLSPVMLLGPAVCPGVQLPLGLAQHFCSLPHTQWCAWSHTSLGLEDGHWQKVQLEKVMGCNLVSSFGVLAWWFQWHLGQGLEFRCRCAQSGSGRLKDYGTQFAATIPEMSKALQVKAAPAEQPAADMAAAPAEKQVPTTRYGHEEERACR